MKGNGLSTVLNKNWSSSEDEGIINISANSDSGYTGGCRVESLKLHGNMDSDQYSTHNHGVYTTTGGNYVLDTYIENCVYGIYVYDFRAGNGGNNVISRNVCIDNKTGIRVYSGTSGRNLISYNVCDTSDEYGISTDGNQTKVIGNRCLNCGKSGILNNGTNNIISENSCSNNSDAGIMVGASDLCTVTGNICDKNLNGIELVTSEYSTLNANVCNDNTESGILLGNNTGYESITANSCYNNSIGINIGSGSEHNTVNGNCCTSNTSFSSSEHTIYCSGTNNLFIGNMIPGKNYTDEGTSNTWNNNKYQ